MTRRRVFAYPYILWMLIFILAPMLLIAYYALTSDGAFTLAHMKDALESMHMQVLWRSILIALRSTAFCLLLGYPVAYMLSRMRRSTAAILSVLFIVPMWMNFLLRTYAWQVILDGNGIINTILRAVGLPAQNMLYTESAVLLGLVYNFLPFMILPIYTSLIKLDSGLIEASTDLGANAFQTFYKVILPLSVPGIVSGITMVFIPSITTFAISSLLGGGKTMMYGDLIQNQFFLGENGWGTGSALAIILLVLVVVSMLIMRRVERVAGVEEETKLW